MSFSLNVSLYFVHVILKGCGPLYKVELED